MKNTVLAEKIKGTPSFHTAPMNDIELMMSSGTETSFSAGSYVYMEGDPSLFFYIIISGKCSLSKHTDRDGERLFSVLSDGDIFGIPEMFLESYSVTAKCSTESVLLKIPRERFFSQLASNQSLTYCFMHLMSSNLHLMQNALVLETAEKRITAYLNWLCRHHGTRTEDGVRINRKVSNSTIASFLSVTREYVFKVMRRLEQEKIISVSDELITVLSPGGLEIRAGMIEDYYIGYQYEN